jgi:hypothetical protein
MARNSLGGPGRKHLRLPCGSGAHDDARSESLVGPSEVRMSLMEDEPLPEPGPPLAVGEHVRFAPTVFATPDDPAWFKWEEAVIVEVHYKSESFGFRFVSEPEGTRHSQGMEVIVRITENYLAWRRAYEEAYARYRRRSSCVEGDREVMATRARGASNSRSRP